eukprot:TRINITY_DN28473_c0_g1_i1.p1 TRINITY_DN28473_c0_g1~~TRINITY_DN28473_c0_g1_i1.p1  ORF type:complete len:438 (-),score=82.16 TRINITY_DN28473_c0_g1_i1:47-1360(-)
MDRFLVRRSTPAAAVCPSSKRQKLEEPDAVSKNCALGSCTGDPQTFITWNVNGLSTQLRDEWSSIRSFLERERPDVVCLQEVRLPAAGPIGCKKGDGQRRRRNVVKCETKQEREEWQRVERTLLGAFRAEYEFYWSLADWKYSGTAMLVKKPLKPSRVAYTLQSLAEGNHRAHQDPADASWHPEGRIIFASFQSFDVLATYAPNNGSDDASFARRAAWDAALLREHQERKRPIVWLGDLNCAVDEVDVSHPDFFAKQHQQASCDANRGQPGFTPAERERFRKILSGGRLVDTYRHLNPVASSPPAGGAHYTWRGSPPVNMPVAKYHGKGMRIDYALVAEELLPRVVDSTILGEGADRRGFMGSDHAPVRLALRLADDAGGCATEASTPSTTGPPAKSPTDKLAGADQCSGADGDAGVKTVGANIEEGRANDSLIVVE